MGNDKIYTPEDNGEQSPTEKLRRNVNEKHALNLVDYHQLYLWSTTNPHLFWDHIWSYQPSILAHSQSDNNNTTDKDARVVILDALPVDNPRWFSGSYLNWAENILTRHRFSNNTALIQSCMSSSSLPTITQS